MFYLEILGFLKEPIFQCTSFLVESRSTLGRKVHSNKNQELYEIFCFVIFAEAGYRYIFMGAFFLTNRNWWVIV